MRDGAAARPPPVAVTPAPVVTAVEAVEAVEALQADEGSGVRQVVLSNAPGLLREACAPVLLNRCS